MAKRGKSKPKRRKASSPAGVSKKSYEKLIKEARNARRRITDFMARDDANNYFVPDPNDYKLASLLNRVASGERVQDIFRELKNLTAEKLKSGTPMNVEARNGYQLTPRDKRKVIDRVTKANKNIQKARKDFDFAVDLMPKEFDVADFVQGITSKESLEAHLKGLELFTPENLVPTAVNDAGEAGTIAEYKYYTGIIERENKRREKLRELTDPRKQQGYFIQQDEYERQPIDTSRIQDMATLRKRAMTWDDLPRIARANQFLTNYAESMNISKSALIVNGMMNETLDKKFQRVESIINQLYWNEEAITFISRRMPALAIAFVSGGIDIQGEGLNEIFKAWEDVFDMYG